MNKKSVVAMGITALISMSAQGALRSYGAVPESSQWEVVKKAQLSCQLNHSIPRFGNASFYTEASKSKPLVFTLDMLIQPDGYSVASLMTVPPIWRPGHPARALGDMKLLKEFDGELDSKASWLMLSELEKGNLPTFYYQDWQNDDDKIKVALSSVNFRKKYQDFLSCRDEMLAYSFDDIAYTVMTYQSNSSELTRDSKKRLDKIGRYLKNDSEIESVYIASYTDSYGGRYKNQTLSLSRAKAIKAYMVELGVEASRIDVDGFGEKRHVATNANILGRDKNRRVVIQIAKP